MHNSMEKRTTIIKRFKRSDKNLELLSYPIQILIRMVLKERSCPRRLSKMELYMRENGMKSPIKGREKVPKYGLMVLSMRDIGETVEPMEREDLFTQMETFMKVIGRTIRPTGSVGTSKKMIFMKKVLITKASGKKTNSMGKAQKNGQMVLYMKETILRERNMETEFSDMQMVPPIKNSS